MSELVEGDSLSRILEAGPLPLERCLEIAIAVAHGVGAAHEAGVVHRDLKPGNILIDAGGRPRICDFGIARPVVGSSLTATRALLGTPHYMAPEQFDSKVGPIGPATDVRALGAILHEMLTGRLPYESDSLADLWLQVLTIDARGIRVHDPTIPAPVEAIVGRALARDPSKRYPTAIELARDLERARDGERIVARRPRRSPARAVGLLAIGAVATAIVLVAAGIGSRPSPGDPPSALDVGAPVEGADAALDREEAVARLDSARRSLELADRSRYDGTISGREVRERAAAARERIEEAIAIDPGMAAAHYSLGQALELEGRGEDAAMAFQAALGIDPRFAPARLALGRNLLDRSLVWTFGEGEEADRRAFSLAEQRSASAIGEIERAIADGATASDDLERTIALAVVALARRDLERVEAICRAGIARHADGDGVEDLYLALAIATSDPSFLDEALALRPHHADALLFRGVQRGRGGDLDGALQDLDRAIEIRPRLFEAHLTRSNLYRQLERWEEALSSLDRAIEIDPDRGAARYNRASVLLVLGRPEEALVDVARFLSRFPGDARGLWRSGQSKFLMGDLEGGLADLDRAIEANPTAIDYRMDRAIAWHSIGRTESALLDLDRILSLDPDKLDALEMRGEILVRHGDPAPAIEDLERVLALAPDRQGPYRFLPWALIPLGRTDRALEIALESVRRWPADPEPRFVVASILTAVGQLEPLTGAAPS